MKPLLIESVRLIPSIKGRKVAYFAFEAKGAFRVPGVGIAFCDHQ